MFLKTSIYAASVQLGPAGVFERHVLSKDLTAMFKTFVAKRPPKHSQLKRLTDEVKRMTEPPLVYRSQKSTETRRMTNGNSGNRFTPEIRARAVCLVLENEADYTSRTQAVLSIAKKIGCNGDTLRVWVRNHEIEIGLRNGVTQAERDELKILQRENKELRQANDILRKASAFFAAAELDRLRKK